MHRIRVILAVFIIWRAIDLLITYLSGMFVPPDPSFPFKWHITAAFYTPQFLLPLANFDGVHYLTIARYGYHMYEQAFFPLYPLLILLFFKLFPLRYFFWGFWISNVSFFIGLVFFVKF